MATTTNDLTATVTRNYVEVVYGDASSVYRYGRPGARFACRCPVAKLLSTNTPSTRGLDLEWHVVAASKDGRWRSLDEDCGYAPIRQDRRDEILGVILAERDRVLDREGRLHATGIQYEAASSQGYTHRILDTTDGRYVIETTRTSGWQGDPPTEVAVSEPYGSLNDAIRDARKAVPWGGM